MGTPTPPTVSIGFAVDGDRSVIPDTLPVTSGNASYSLGFPPRTRTNLIDGGIPPDGLDMNGILYELGANIAWITAGGQYGFSADVVTNQGGYNVGAIVHSAANDQTYWLCISPDNILDPDVDSTGWFGFAVVPFLTDTAQLADETANPPNSAGKYAGRLAWDGTSGLMMRAAGSLATDKWVSLDGAVSITPGSPGTSGDLQAAAGTGTVNNFALQAYCRFLDVTPTGDVTITGFAAGLDNQTVTVTNLHATFLYTIAPLNGGSSAANQIRGRGISLEQYDSFTMRYSAALAKWVVQ